MEYPMQMLFSRHLFRLFDVIVNEKKAQLDAHISVSRVSTSATKYRQIAMHLALFFSSLLAQARNSMLRAVFATTDLLCTTYQRINSFELLIIDFFFLLLVLLRVFSFSIVSSHLIFQQMRDAICCIEIVIFASSAIQTKSYRILVFQTKAFRFGVCIKTRL